MMWHDIEQNTEEWYQLRAGKITASSACKFMAHLGKAFGDPANAYAVDIAIGQITGNPPAGGYSNHHMDRGHEEEPLARMKYEEEYFCEVANGGFFEVGDCGTSPDGLVGTDGMIEIKSVVASTHYKNIARQSYDPAYKWQIVFNLYVTQRDWIDFVSYCGAFPDDKKIFVFRCTKESFSDEFELLRSRLDEFRILIASCKNKILNSSYSIIN